MIALQVSGENPPAEARNSLPAELLHTRHQPRPEIRCRQSPTEYHLQKVR
jgi:hypothetical protein